nr:polysialyltransferase family glycosyltransferase [Providencia rettgeri]
MKTAYAITEQYKKNEKYIYSIESDDDEYFSTIKNTVATNIPVIKTEPINWIFERFNFLLKYRSLQSSYKKILSIYTKYQISEIFIHYPVHEKEALYMKAAKKLKIKINFYEEGSCFYTDRRGRKLDVYSRLKFFIRKSLLKCLNINYGYQLNADGWYSILPVKKQPNHLIKISYKKIECPNLKYLFLSRPVFDDYPSISFDLYIQSIIKFINTIPKNETLFIKFHPRESLDNQRKTIDKLNSYSSYIEVKKLDLNIAAEDIVYNMEKGSSVCAFDSSTLIYGNSINSNIKFHSVLNHIYMYDEMNELSNLYSLYTKKFSHIEYIKWITTWRKLILLLS